MVLYNERVISHPRVAKQNEADRFQPSNSGRSIRHLRCDNSPITTCALRAAQAAPQTTGGGFSASCEERVRVLGSQVVFGALIRCVWPLSLPLICLPRHSLPVPAAGEGKNWSFYCPPQARKNLGPLYGAFRLVRCARFTSQEGVPIPYTRIQPRRAVDRETIPARTLTSDVTHVHVLYHSLIYIARRHRLLRRLRSACS